MFHLRPFEIPRPVRLCHLLQAKNVCYWVCNGKCINCGSPDCFMRCPHVGSKTALDSEQIQGFSAKQAPPIAASVSETKRMVSLHDLNGSLKAAQWCGMSVPD
eukprot:g1546.t1